MRRVVVTGMGIVSPCGTGVNVTWNNIINGKSGIKTIDTFDTTNLSCKIAGIPKQGTENGECNFLSILDSRSIKKMDKMTLYALVAADEALKDSCIDLNSVDLEKFGVSIGGGIGGINTIYSNCIELYKNDFKYLSPFFIPKVIINMMAGQISIKYGLKGPNISMVTACASSNHAIGEAMRLIKYGDADIMVCGGGEASVCEVGIAGFCAMRALSTRNDNPEKASRPWDKKRDGFVMGEGSGILILEEYEHAKKRGANIYAEIKGYGLSGDAHHITAPSEDGNGGKRAMINAIKDANLTPIDIDYINAHGTSTVLGDISELNAVKQLFEDNKNISMSSTKSMTGHLLGAAGAIEAIFSILAIKNNIMPPTINLEDPDDLVGDFDLVANKMKEKRINNVISNSFGFGGTNASLLFGKI